MHMSSIAGFPNTQHHSVISSSAFHPSQISRQQSIPSVKFQNTPNYNFYSFPPNFENIRNANAQSQRQFHDEYQRREQTSDTRTSQLNPLTKSTPGSDIVGNRVDSEAKGFLSNAFFSHQKSDKVSRKWSLDDEMRWQATTKAPYFENKVPGLECTLPASAVLEATTALRASSLLPLHVPIGKPVLSCNATELLQAQIYLNGIIYDCDDSEVTLSCPRLDANNLIVDECHGDILECDVRTRRNSRSVSCTNGTLISNYPIVCRSATLSEKKNVLNCFYGSDGDSPRSSGVSRRLREDFNEFTTEKPIRQLSWTYSGSEGDPDHEDGYNGRPDQWKKSSNGISRKRSSGL